MERHRVSRRNYYVLGVILLAYLIIALGYGAVTPLFEAPDEHYHAFTALTIAESGELPSVQSEFDPWLGAEPAQPPMYYVLAATTLELFDMSQARDLTWFNPRVQLGDASSPQNINAFVHSPAEDWPWQGHVLAFHLLRALSAIAGLGTLLCIFGSARLLWPTGPERALLATALVAFLPQYGFLHGSVSNDPLIILLSSLTLFHLLRLWYLGVSTKRLLVTGTLIGLAIMTKMAGLLLLAFALVFVVSVAWRDCRDAGIEAVFKRGIRFVGLTALPAFILGGWVLWRNWTLYEDVTATAPIIQIYGGDRGFSIIDVLGESSGLWTSMFAVFGWFNVIPPQWVYAIWNLIVLLSAIGVGFSAILFWDLKRDSGDATFAGQVVQFLARIIRKPEAADWPGMPALLLGLWVLIVYAGLVIYSLQIHGSQGRLLFPAIMPVALALAYGISQFRWKGILIVVSLLALLTTMYCLLVVIPNAYARPPAIQRSEIPADTITLEKDLGDDLELIGYLPESSVVRPDDLVWLTLYWQSRVTGDGDFEAPEYVMELFGREDQLIGKVQSYHGGGLYPATLWKTGEIIADRLAIRLDENLVAPVEGRLIVKLSGREETAEVGTVKIAPPDWPESSEIVLATLNGLEITDASLEVEFAVPGAIIPVRVRWQVRAPVNQELTTFVHFGDPSQEPLVQGDRPPLDGHYPTHLWEEGEVVDDLYILALPPDLAPGRYPVYLGLYDPISGARLPLHIQELRQPNDAYLVGWVSVE